MKKTLIIAALLATLGSMQAQDTIQMRDMRLMSGYYVPNWFDSFVYDSVLKVYRGDLQNNSGWEGDSGKEEAEYMYTNDTLQVYGIAVCLTSMLRLYPSYMQLAADYGLDTTHSRSHNYMRLYEADADSIRFLGEELEVHLRNTPVSYYIDLDLCYPTPGLTEKLPILPMYERYFSSPITVVDSFYVGRRYGPDHDLSMFEGGIIQPRLTNITPPWPTIHRAFHVLSVQQIVDHVNDTVIYDTLNGWIHQITNNAYNAYPFLFPILTPEPVTPIIPDDSTGIDPVTPVNPDDSTGIVNPDDSTGIDPVNPGDTLAVRSPALLDRYTAAFPNPASDKVTVVSSFGLSRIEAFDAQGRLVYNTTCPPALSASLDVSSWPRGSYLLRIHTPAGTTTKKLLVQ